jgi:hypothetical protein
MAEQYGIIGDDYGTSLPEMAVDKKEMMEEKKAARFSKTTEFKKLKEHLEQRIEFYQSYLPDGRPISEDFSRENWVIANAIIGEFRAVINAYEQAREIVEQSNAR